MYTDNEINKMGSIAVIIAETVKLIVAIQVILCLYSLNIYFHQKVNPKVDTALLECNDLCEPNAAEALLPGGRCICNMNEKTIRMER